MQIRRAHEGHAPVARGPIDRHAGIEEPLARLVDVVDLEREVAEEAPDRVGLGLIPVVGELDLGALEPRAQEDEREAAALVLLPAHLAQAEFTDEEIERGIEVADTQHRVEESHGAWILPESCACGDCSLYDHRAMTERGLTILFCLATALAAGFVIGAEREQRRAATFGGIRTFPLVALAGALGALVHVWALVGAGVAITALLTVSYLRATQGADEDDAGLSTEIAAIATFGLGALSTAEWTGLVTTDRLLLVGAGATAVLALLALKRTLHDFAESLSNDDVYATAKLLLLAVVVLPALPDRDLGPWNALNPRSIGLLVVMISAIGFAGYIAIRIFGAHKGLGLTGLLGGLASSTAVTLTFSGRAKQSPELVTSCAVAIVLASATMFPRIGLELAAVSPALAAAAAWPLVVTAVVALAAGGVLYLRLSAANRGVQDAPTLVLKNPLTLSSALKFALLFTCVLLISRAMASEFAEMGVLVSALVTGLADVDAISLTVARMHAQGTVDLSVAVLAVAMAIASNTVSKTGIALVLGGPGLALRFGLAMGAALLAGAFVTLLTMP